MHIIDFWLECLHVFYPSNLNSFVAGIARQLGSTFSFLFIQRWWVSLPLLFSHLVLYGLFSLTGSGEILSVARIILFCAQVYFAFLATLVTFPFVHAKSSAYFSMRQGLFWPIVTPFVLWAYFSWIPHKLLADVLSYKSMMVVVQACTFALMISIDWFASPFFVFFAFIIIDTYAKHGVLYALEHAFTVLLYSYPLCAFMFGCLYGLQWLLAYGFSLGLLINSMAILIPVAAVLYGAVYQWYMQLVD